MLDTTAVLLATVLGLGFLLYSWPRPTRSVPRVSYWVPFVGSSMAFSKDPVGFLNACKAAYGSVFEVLLAGQRMTFITAPNHYATILKAKTLSHKPIFSEIEQRAFGETPEWAVFRENASTTHAELQRFMKSPAPHLANRSAVAALVERTFERQRLVLAGLEPNKMHRVSLLTFVEHAIFASGTRVMLGDALAAAHPTLPADFLAFDAAFPLLVAGCIPSAFLAKGIEGRERLVAALQAAPLTDSAALIQVRDEVLRALPEVQDADRARTHVEILWAASANSIPTTFWALFHLLRNPMALTAVRAEIAAHLPLCSLTGSVVEPWTQEMLQQCVLLESAVDESLRLAASSMLVRVAVEPTDLVLNEKTYHFNKGDRVAIFPSLGHFDPEIFPNPTEFQLDRFVAATKAQLEAFKPFGMGATMCPGRYFAKNQVKMFVALTLQHLHDLRIVPGYAAPTLDPSRLGLGVIPPADRAIEVEFRV
ncbi:cholesterol 7-alpha-monooxygenase-like [Achlya hypogyna]|uniref:Cholesterol 7-alpha-monooxygenase-like n=1 Tax=Achlya hypogyna TaxID=1202772 RepID=A0A1V9YV56_ACHHY|nr:cholesterol 7-alpha-monooxygenase-like [Achlya hypogyna]